MSYKGGVFGPIKCSVQVDTIGKECIENDKHLYKYKDTVGIPPLGMVDDLLAVAECGVDSVLTNSYINAKTKIKKLQFGVDKCHKIHIGSNHNKCPLLYVDHWKEVKNIETDETVDKCEDLSEIDASREEKYLGDIITNDGKNTKNIESRMAKGQGNIDQVMSILEEICFGQYQFEAAVLLRNSLLISSLLTNSEAWHNVTTRDIENLESIDEKLLRRILEAPITTPKEMLYLELGCCPIRFLIKQRRIMFLQYILKQEEDSLIYQVLEAQYKNPTKNDWILEVLENLQDFNIEQPFEEIMNMSKDKFKSIVTTASEKKALEYLNKVKMKHSKVRHIKHKSLELQCYLEPENVNSVQDSKFTFLIRTRMLDIKNNFENKYKDQNCIACEKETETQEHILKCKKLSDGNLLIGTLPKYEDIFGTNMEKISTISSIMKSCYSIRRKFLKK